MSWWEIFLFFLPAGISNTSPPFTKFLPGLKDWETSLDFGKKWRGKRIFGDHKTWRGLIFGTIMAAVIGIGQYFYMYSGEYSFFFILGATTVMGFGALAGDAVESFLKRQRGIKSGDRWFPFDQTDYIIGGLLLSYPFFRPTFETMIMTLVLYFLLHLLVAYLSYRLKLKDKPI